MAMSISIVDAFTDRAFAGNPAAVCLLEGDLDDAALQRIAAEMNLSETSFVYPTGDGWSLRWFTPTVEVPLCGHATLATAHRLWQLGLVGLDHPIHFVTRKSGGLICRRDGAGLITMDFPADPPTPGDPPAELIADMGIDRDAVVAAVKGKDKWLIELRDESAVLEVSPDFPSMRRHHAPGVGITAQTDRAGFDAACRFFAPTHGIDEDPVTGSLHCLLGPYWANKLGKGRIESYQASKRGGAVSVTMRGDRCELAGRAVTVVEGELLAD